MSICDSCFTNHKCAKYAKGERLGTFCIKNFKLSSLYDLALVSEKQRKHINLRIDEDGTDREQFLYLKQIEENIHQFVKDGRNLYLYSTGCGNGKTSWSLRLLQSYLNTIWYSSSVDCKALFISVPKFFLMLKDNIGSKNDYITHIKEYVADCDIVIWDDLGTKVGTEFEIENLLNIISNRIDNGKTNIYTSNITPDMLQSRVGERLYSRVVNMSECVQLSGSDKRGIV